jgi:hypothetical protein
MKLNQVIAILSVVKAEATKAKTAVHRLSDKADLFSGLSRTYEPREEDGYVYPPETQQVQLTYKDLLEQFAAACSALFDNAATQDWANTQAQADVIVEGEVMLKNVPIPYLLFLEKQLTDIKTFVLGIPERDINEEWKIDEDRGFWITEPRYTTKTKKITKPVTLYEATKEHPAQVTQVTEDIVEGQWKAVKFTGAISKVQKEDLLKRVRLLSEAVVFAREEANSLQVEKKKVAQILFAYLFKV